MQNPEGLIESMPKKRRIGHEERNGMVDMAEVKESGLSAFGPKKPDGHTLKKGHGKRDLQKSSRERKNMMHGKDMVRTSGRRDVLSARPLFGVFLDFAKSRNNPKPITE